MNCQNCMNVWLFSSWIIPSDAVRESNDCLSDLELNNPLASFLKQQTSSCRSVGWSYANVFIFSWNYKISLQMGVKSNCRIYFPCLCENPHILRYPEEPSWSLRAFLQCNIRVLWLVRLLINSGSLITQMVFGTRNHRGTLESPYTTWARCRVGCFHVHLHMHLR